MKLTLALLAVMAVLVISTSAQSTTKEPGKGASKHSGTKPSQKPRGQEKPSGSDTNKASSHNGRRSTLSKGETRTRPTGTGTRQTAKRAKAFY